MLSLFVFGFVYIGNIIAKFSYEHIYNFEIIGEEIYSSNQKRKIIKLVLYFYYDSRDLESCVKSRSSLQRRKSLRRGEEEKKRERIEREKEDER